MQETSTIPHGWVLLSSTVAAILTFITTVAALWFKRKHGPAEVRKIDAEAKSIHVSTEISPVGITLETLREIQLVIEKAETRREAWLLKEEQLRNQIVFWRNKAEELDGELIDERNEHAQTATRLRMKTDDLEKAMGIIKGHHLSFAELDQPKH